MRLDTSDVASLPSYLDQDGLHGEVTLPLAQAGELVELDLVSSVLASMSYVCVPWQDIPCRFSDLRRAG
jgi:hypothetical protein